MMNDTSSCGFELIYTIRIVFISKFRSSLHESERLPFKVMDKVWVRRVMDQVHKFPFNMQLQKLSGISTSVWLLIRGQGPPDLFPSKLKNKNKHETVLATI